MFSKGEHKHILSYQIPLISDNKSIQLLLLGTIEYIYTIEHALAQQFHIMIGYWLLAMFLFPNQ